MDLKGRGTIDIRIIRTDEGKVSFTLNMEAPRVVTGVPEQRWLQFDMAPEEAMKIAKLLTECAADS